ncbi:biotin-dependent carboxyltransferase [Rhodobacteraceae bacterium CCMM004]|nr:biotin-dependent carboxyltransferase [Rhodobacteraceae bacterium CCMM004]
MSRSLTVVTAPPGLTVQDLGRPGWLAQGVPQGGAADRLALAEGAALLGQEVGTAALEMAAGGVFRASADMRIALTGAPARAEVDGRRLAWNASHLLHRDAQLAVSAPARGVWSYLHLGGGIATPPQLGSRAAHLSLGLGLRIEAGAALPLGDDPGGPTEMRLEIADRCGGGPVRILPGVHTALFSEDDRARFAATGFRRGARGNRQGIALDHDGALFAAQGQLDLVSEVVVPGDVQMTGSGQPYVLLPECQTIGGYPRIGTVAPVDLPRVAQAPPGAPLRFDFVTLEAALADHATPDDWVRRLARAVQPLRRDPADIPDLLSYTLVSGVTAGDPPP